MLTPADIETLLASQPWCSMLRPEERLRLGASLRAVEITEDAPLVLDPGRPTMVLLGQGQVRISGDREEVLFPGDAVGLIAVCTRQGLSATLRSTRATALLLDRPGLDEALAHYPAMAPAFLAEVTKELKWKNDILREVSLAHAEGLVDDQLGAVLRGRQRRIERRHVRAVRRGTRSLLRRLIVEPLRQPVFFALLGFVLALSIARAVVGEIIAKGAQKHFFALIGGAQGNPIHIHHFNYGILLVTITGFAVLYPRARQYLRFLGFTFGFGCGLVTDEFALLWNLDPDYYQRSSRVAMLLVGGLLVQIVYLRGVYAQLARRALGRANAWMRGRGPR